MQRLQLVFKQARKIFLRGRRYFLALSLPKKVLLLAFIALCLGLVIRQLSTSTAKKPVFQTAQVERGSVISTLTESGNVAALMQTSVSSPTTGVMEELYINNGDKVTAGQNLFKVKATATPQDVQQAYASLLSAQNSAQNAQQSKQALQSQLETARQGVLNAQNAVDQMNDNRSTNNINPATKQAYTQNEIDSINSSLTSAKESFTATETKYKQADNAIAAANASETAAAMSYQRTQDAIVTAPVGGTVANLEAVVGGTVSGSSGGGNSNASSSNNSGASSSTTTGSPVLIIGDFSSLSVKVQINEIDRANIHAGEKATVTLDAFPGKTYVGTVDSVDTIGTTTSGVVTYGATINLLAPPDEIKPGMSATAVIQTQRHDNVLMVPSTAVQIANGESTVRILKNGKPQTVTVTTGISSDTETEITSGLSEGQTVITSLTIPQSSSGSTATSPFSPGANRGFGTGGFGGGRGGRVFIQQK